MIAAIDLAGKYSAYCIVDLACQVLYQASTWQISLNRFFQGFAHDASPCDLIIIEDLPHSVKFGKIVKNASRAQGRLAQELDRVNSLDKALFIPPQVWQMYYPGVYRTDKNKKNAASTAKSLGYEPPELLTKSVRGKDRITARKIMTDFTDSWLIANWACSKIKEHGGIEQFKLKENRLQPYEV